MKVIGCDMYNQTLTGDVTCALTASMDVAGHSGPKVLILNDQGGSVMDTSEDVTSTLRAQDHGHPPIVCMTFDVYNMQGNDNVFKTLNHIATDSDHIPVVCFEPGILRRDCSAGNRAYVDICSTLRAQMGDNQPAVCFPINLMVATRGGKDDMRTCFGIGGQNDPQFTLSSAHEHGVCYEVNNAD